MAITQVIKATHVAEAQSHLVEQFKGKANFLALIRAFINQVADIEAAAFQVLNETTLAASVGAQLDGIGQIVGEERLGRTDAEYRQAISARILINLSSGTPEDIIEIFSVLEPAAGIELTEYPPASFVMTLLDAVTGEPDVLLRSLRTSKPAGVATALVYSLTAFPFLLGPAWTVGPDQLVNGNFSAWTGDNPDTWITIESAPGEVTERGSGQGNAGIGTGACNFYRPSGNAFVQQSIITIPGRTYRMTINISFHAGTGDLFVTPNPGEFATQTFSTTGVKTIEWIATGTGVNFAIGALTGGDITVDSISVVDVDAVAVDSDFSLGRASPLDNGSFRLWDAPAPAGDPVDWTVLTGGAGVVSEVGEGEGSGGSGTGSCNLLQPGGGDFAVIRQTFTNALIAGRQYELRIDVSFVGGPTEQLFVDDTDAANQFSAVLPAGTGTKVLPFTGQAATPQIDIATNGSVGNITIDNVRIVDVGLVVNPEFERWTADDPDGWTVNEVVPFSEVSQVGQDQAHGGTGLGACNLFSLGGTGGQYVAGISITSIPVTPGNEYVMRVRFSRFKFGTCFYGVTGLVTADLVDAQATQEGIVEHRFTANDSTIDIGFFGTQDLVTFVVAAHDFTVDWIEIVPLNTDTRGLLATVVE